MTDTEQHTEHTFRELEEHFYSTVKHFSLRQRKMILKKLKKWVLDNRQQIRDAVYNDFKKHEAEVDVTEIRPVVSEVNHALKKLDNWAAPQKVNPDLSLLGTRSKVIIEPMGVVLVLAPWNFPFNLTLGPFISAIAAGNCVIVKPSEHTPHTSQLIKDMAEALFDPAMVRVFTGDYHVASTLLKLPFHHIFFTGSPRVGKIVMREAAENLAGVTLELGGQNPAIVDRTADLKDTARKLIYGKFMNAGQSCVSINYLLVHQDVQHALIRHLKDAFEALYGSPEHIVHNADFPRIVNHHHFQRICSLLDDAVENGAELVMGGERNEADRFIAPAMLTNVSQSAALMQDEIFGPLLPIVPYQELDEALRYINTKPRPLALYIFSTSNKNIDYSIQKTTAGSTAINDTTLQFVHPELPFGGINHSGIGKAHGYYGFMAFSNQRSVLRQRRGFTSFKLVYPPYTKKVQKIIDFIIKYL